MAPMTHPTNPDLEAAVRARSDEDTPRLAYADWLDDHGDPVRAEWIRVQCRLADLNPTAPDYFDLRERQEELACRLKHRRWTDVGGGYDRFYFGIDLISQRDDPFRRGFPFTIDCQTSEWEWTPEETRRVVRDFTKLAGETTIRGLRPYRAPVEALTELLRAPVCADLRALDLTPQVNHGSTSQQLGAFYTFLGTNPLLRGLRQLYLHSEMPEPALRALARATVFGSLRRLGVRSLHGPAAELTKLAGSGWFRGLRQLHLSCDSNGGALLKRLATSTELDTLELPGASATEVRELAAGKWPALARLTVTGAQFAGTAKALAKARFPTLVEFRLGGRLHTNDLLALLNGDWAARLRALDLDDTNIGDTGAKALAARPLARSLRHLLLGDNPIGKSGLAALATGFPALTVLNLRATRKRTSAQEGVTAFLAALGAPLRHLNADGWPLGDEGAKALAANPALGGLTRLSVSDCGIGNAGVKALLASPHLRNVVELRTDGNRADARALNALADPDVLPHLGECWIDGTKRLEQKIERARPNVYALALSR
jgi:uncharacterized protein (TIGR02996 family)